MKHLLLSICSFLLLDPVFSQNVGIGTTTPAYKLDVRNGSINNDSAYRLRGLVFIISKGGGGSESSLFGYKAGANITSGYDNIAVGSSTQFFLNSGFKNIGMGNYALWANQSGSYNTAMGDGALQRPETANYNTALGYDACSNHLAGWNNTLLGAEADVNFSGQYNSIAIGNMALATDNSKVRIGNSSNWSYETFANWTNISDGRYKKNIQENVAGLDFIMKLRPVNYQMDITGLSKKFGEDKGRENDNFMKVAIAEKEQMTWTGFIAQEVEVAASEANFNFSGVDKPRNEHGVYGLRYAEFVVPLVKAMQEQQVIIEKQNQAIESLQKQNEELKNKQERIEKVLLSK